MSDFCYTSALSFTCIVEFKLDATQTLYAFVFDVFCGYLNLKALVIVDGFFELMLML